MQERTEIKLQACPAESDKFHEHIRHLLMCGINVRLVDHLDDDKNVVQHFAFYEVEREC